VQSAFGVEHIAKFQGASKDPSRKELRTGQALNVVAATGGGHAAYMTGRDIVREVRGTTRTGKHEAPAAMGRFASKAAKIKVLKPIAENPKRAALAGLGAWGGLHSAELVGDAIAARTLHSQIKKTPKTTVRKRDSRHMPRHPLTPRKTVPDDVSPMLPASTVKAYDNSRHHKGEAAALNLGSKLGAGAAGGLAGAAVAAKVLPKAKFFRGASTVAGHTISADKKVGFAASSLGGSVGGAAGGTAGALTLRHIQKNPRYRYRRS
jgi:hypothetical protein